MVTEKTLSNFLEKKSEIIALCKKNYMTNLRLIIPGMPENKDRVHLLVDAQEGKVSMLDDIRVQKEIEKLIQCPVFVMTEGDIHKILKADMLHYPIPIEDDEAIKQRFEVELILFSKDPKVELPLLSKPESKKQHLTSFNPKFNGGKTTIEPFDAEEVSNHKNDKEETETNGAFHLPTFRCP